MFLCLNIRVVSSANCTHSESCKCRCKSFTNIRKMRGPRQDPCGVPYSTLYSLLVWILVELTVLYLTQSFLPVK